MTIQRTSQLLAGGVALLTLLAVAGGFRSRSHHHEATRAAETRLHAARLLREVAASSERLTTAVRSYAATGDRRHYDAYVREVTVDRARDQALLGLQRLGLTAGERAVLTAVKQHGDALITLDNRAFEAAMTRNPPAATALLYGPEYRQTQLALGRALREAENTLDQRWAAHQAARQGRARRWATVALLAALANAGLMLAALLYYLPRRLTAPLGALSRRAREVLRRGEDTRSGLAEQTSEIEALGLAVESCRRWLEEKDRQRWVRTQVAELADELQPTENLNEFAQRLLAKVVAWLQGGWAVLYVPDESGRRLSTLSCCGGPPFPDPERAFALGEGVVGQAAESSAPLTFTEVPRDYPKVQSARGECLPRAVVAVPVRSRSRLLAVLEVASPTVLTEAQQALFNELGAVVAPRLELLHHQLQMREMLDQARRQTAELQARLERQRATDVQAAKTQALVDLLHALPAAVFCLDATGIQAANAAALALLGCASAEDLRGTKLSDLAAEAQADGALTPAGIEADVAAAMRGETVRSEWRLRRRTGEALPVEAELRRTEVTGQPAVLVLVRDLSERQRLEAELQTARQRLAQLTAQEAPPCPTTSPAADVAEAALEPPTSLAPEAPLAPDQGGPPSSTGEVAVESDRPVTEVAGAGPEENKALSEQPPDRPPEPLDSEANPEPPPAPARRRKHHRDDQMDLFAPGSKPAAAAIAPEQADGPADNAQRSNAADPASQRETELEAPAEARAPASDSAVAEQVPRPTESTPGAPSPPARTARRPRPRPAEAPPPPIEPARHRPLVNQMMTLLAESDPGAVDCLAANRDDFRALFTPSGFAQFEQRIQAHAFSEALEPLLKAARKHSLVR